MQHLIKVSLKKLVLLMLISIFLMPCLASAEGMSNDEIEATLVGHNEAGYKYVQKLDEGIWKTVYAKPGWQYGWEVIITTTSPKPENSIVVIGTSILTTEHITGAFLLKLLDENSYDTNPGNYSIFSKDGMYSVQYAVKLPQMMLKKDALIEAIGFVAGYSNSRVKDLEASLSSSNANKPATESATEANKKAK